MTDKMEIDTPTEETTRSTQNKSDDSTAPPRFEVKKLNAVSLWAWDIVVDNCAICRNHIMDLWYVQHYDDRLWRAYKIALSARQIRPIQHLMNVLLHGEFVTMHSTSIVSLGGSKRDKFAPWTIASGSSRSMVGDDVWKR